MRQSPPDAVGDAESISAISSHTLSSQSTVVPSTKPKPPTTIHPTSPSTVLPAAPSEPGNPWLNIQSSSSSKVTRKKNEIVVGKSSGLAEKSKNRLRKHQEKHDSEREKAKDDAVVEISVNSILNLRPDESERTNPPPVSKAKVAAQADVDSDGDSGANSEVEEQERRLTEKKRKGKGKAKDQGAVKPFAQRDLVSLAFAGDKVVQVCSPRVKQAPCIHQSISRTSKRPSSGRSSKTHQRKWILPCLDGCDPFPNSLGCQRPHTQTTLGLVGWDWYQKSPTKTVPRQEGRWHRSPIPRRLWENSRHHL